MQFLFLRSEKSSKVEHECQGRVCPGLWTWLCCLKACSVKHGPYTVCTGYVLVLLQVAVTKSVELLVEQKVSALCSSPPLVFLPRPCSLVAEWCCSSCLCTGDGLWCRFSARPALSASTTDEMSSLLTESSSPGRGKGRPFATRISPLLANDCAFRQGTGCWLEGGRYPSWELLHELLNPVSWDWN